MSATFCTRCGSRTHTAYDCSAPDQNLAPPEPTRVEEATEEVKQVVAAPEVEQVGLLHPVHPSWPPTCAATRLAAFADEAAVAAFNRRWCPRCKVTKVWRCERCGLWHFDATSISPSGDSSGHERSSRYPRTPFVPFMRKPMRESAFGPQSELPKREEPAAKERQVKVPRREPKREGMLF